MTIPDDHTIQDVRWHYKGRLIWMGLTREGHDIEKDVKTGKMKRVWSLKQRAAQHSHK